MAVQCWLDHGIWRVNSISFWPTVFWFCHKILSQIFWKKLNFQLNFCIIWSLAFWACLKVMCITWIDKPDKQRVLSGHWCRIRLRASFFHGFFAESCQNIGFLLDLSTLPNTFHLVLQTIKVNWASWRPLDCLETRLRASQGTLARS